MTARPATGCAWLSVTVRPFAVQELEVLAAEGVTAAEVLAGISVVSSSLNPHYDGIASSVDIAVIGIPTPGLQVRGAGVWTACCRLEAPRPCAHSLRR